ncbi:hypothetical protein DID77_01665 [Candidatus Marinamargulisbacteria bacterium SCGC AG-439-L15]|nr:hypothetical protein DID77_01665 [Candidatus Marinamargulisbacteria bacterium SCGC AG-439-L15]
MSVLGRIGHNHQHDLASRIVDKMDTDTIDVAKSQKRDLSRHLHETHHDVASVLVDKIEDSQLNQRHQKGDDAASAEAGAAEASGFSQTIQKPHQSTISHSQVVRARAQTAGLDHHHETAQVLAKVGEDDLPQPRKSKKKRRKSIPKPQKETILFEGSAPTADAQVKISKISDTKKSNAQKVNRETTQKKIKDDPLDGGFVKTIIDKAADHGLQLGAAAAGATIGSVIPGAGTLVGAGIGLVLGAVFKYVFHKVEDKIIEEISPSSQDKRKASPQ